MGYILAHFSVALVQPIVELYPGLLIINTNTVSVLGGDEGYTVKYTPLSEGVLEGYIRGLFDLISQVKT